jgi:hypothetical protein
VIEPSVIYRIEHLLAEKRWSQRKIARMANVSRGTVAAVASGRRRAHRVPPVNREDESIGPVQRCPGCGGMASMPCRLCRSRELAARRDPRSPRITCDASLRLELSEEHQKRYLEVRRQRWEEARP